MPYSCSAHRNLPLHGIWGNSLLDAENEYDADFTHITSRTVLVLLERHNPAELELRLWRR